MSYIDDKAAELLYMNPAKCPDCGRIRRTITLFTSTDYHCDWCEAVERSKKNVGAFHRVKKNPTISDGVPDKELDDVTTEKIYVDPFADLFLWKVRNDPWVPAGYVLLEHKHLCTFRFITKIQRITELLEALSQPRITVPHDK